MIKEKNIQISQPTTGDEEWYALRESLQTSWITSGPKVKEFESLFAKKHEVKHAIAVTSATSALHLSLIALGIRSGDEVIVPAFTWIATANVVLYCGAKVKFVDIDTNTFNICIKDLKSKINTNTKAIIPVHLFGLCANIDAIREIAPNIKIVEDAACAVGAKYKNKYAGNLGDIACFSFHPRKIITTGEGGMITTNNDILADRVSKLRNHGAEISEEQRHKGPKPFILPDFKMLGYNYRMTDLQGSIGTVQLSKLDKLLQERRKWAEYYINKLSDIPWIRTPIIQDNYLHSWQSFVIMIDENKVSLSRNDIMEYLQERGISTRPGTHSLHTLDYYKNLYNISADSFPNAKKANDNSMAIPLHNKMDEEDYIYIVNSIKGIN